MQTNWRNAYNEACFILIYFKALKSYDIDYLLVGGLAMNLHGVPRMTMDVDLVIALKQAAARAQDISYIAYLERFLHDRR